MNIDQYQEAIERSKTWEEAERIAKDFFQCPDNHEKIVTTLYKPLKHKRNKQFFYAKHFNNIACLECKTKKYNCE